MTVDLRATTPLRNIELQSNVYNSKAGLFYYAFSMSRK